jgi:hypothetical protein
MSVVGERFDNFGAGVDEFAVKLAKSVGIVEDDFGDVGAG